MRYALLLLSFCAALIAKAQDPSLALKAQDAYGKGEYDKALALYDSVNTSSTSASLLFNIGNCHMKLGNVPQAILYYERSIRLSPGAEDIQANLDFARSRTVDRVNELPGLALGTQWEHLRSGGGVDQWARISLICCLVCCAIAAWGFTARPGPRKRALLITAGLVMLITLGTVGLAWYRVHEVTDRSEAIVMSPKVDVLSEPRKGGNALFVLHEGTKVEVLTEQDGWIELKLGNGSVGWAPPNTLVVI